MWSCWCQPRVVYREPSSPSSISVMRELQPMSASVSAFFLLLWCCFVSLGHSSFSVSRPRVLLGVLRCCQPRFLFFKHPGHGYVICFGRVFSGCRFLSQRVAGQSGDMGPLVGRGRKIALDVAMGLAFLHSHNVVHLDIKSGNILLARNLTAKISDVGLARQLQSGQNSSIKGVGTFQYAAPEVLTGEMKVGRSSFCTHHKRTCGQALCFTPSGIGGSLQEQTLRLRVFPAQVVLRRLACVELCRTLSVWRGFVL